MLKISYQRQHPEYIQHNYEHVYSLKAEINTKNTINKKVKVKLYTNGQNKKNTKNYIIWQ